jgi:hypothetical protein
LISTSRPMATMISSSSSWAITSRHRSSLGRAPAGDVPITIVARDKTVDRIAGWGWQPGLKVRTHRSGGWMSSVTLLTAYGPQAQTQPLGRH